MNPRPKSHQFQFSHSVISSSATPWTAACQASLSITNSQSLLKLISIESVMPYNHLILGCSLLLPSIFPSIRVFSNESDVHIRQPTYWSFSFSISPSNEYSGLISFTSFPDSSVGKEFTFNAGDPGSVPGPGRSDAEGIGYPLQYSWTSLWLSW